MLRQILKAFGENSVLSTAGLASQAGIPDSMLLHMLDGLVSMGYLAENDSCESSCSHCQQATACQSLSTQRLWLLTTKGREAIKEMP